MNKNELKSVLFKLLTPNSYLLPLLFHRTIFPQKKKAIYPFFYNKKAQN